MMVFLLFVLTLVQRRKDCIIFSCLFKYASQLKQSQHETGEESPVGCKYSGHV